QDWILNDPAQQMPTGRVYCLLPSRADDGSQVVWAGMEGGGLYRIDANGPRRPSFALPDDRVRVLLETSATTGARTLWVGTDRGRPPQQRVQHRRVVRRQPRPDLGGNDRRRGDARSATRGRRYGPATPPPGDGEPRRQRPPARRRRDPGPRRKPCHLRVRARE